MFDYNISFLFQVLVVAGGYVSLSLSTEKLTIGDDAWTYGNPLPRKIWGVATVSLDNKVFLTGKLFHRIGILLMFSFHRWIS